MATNRTNRSQDWMTRLRSAWGLRRKGTSRPRLVGHGQPSLGREFVVVEDDGVSCRVALVQLDHEHGVCVPLLETAAASQGSREAVAELCRRLGPLPPSAIVVTWEARPRVLGNSAAPSTRRAGGIGADPGPSSKADREDIPRVVSSLPARQAQRWSEALSSVGLNLAGIYPLAGCPIAGITWEPLRQPSLCIQLERDMIVVMEAAQGGCRGIDVHEHEQPSVKRCVELIGPECPEVWLCGGGADLSEFGYDLVKAGTTWVHIPGLKGKAEFTDPPPESLSSIVGAARHACGLAPRDAVPCVLPYPHYS